MTRHETGLRKTGWNGLLLGYSQVPAEEMAEAVGRLAKIVYRSGDLAGNLDQLIFGKQSTHAVKAVGNDQA
jgi:hypothetical protein